MEISTYIENDVYVVIPKNEYDIAILTGSEKLDSFNDNVDVEVRFKTGELYTATFFTPQNINSIFEKNKQTGENCSGLYFYAQNMIIVEALTIENIVATIIHLVEQDMLESTFSLEDTS